MFSCTLELLLIWASLPTTSPLNLHIKLFVSSYNTRFLYLYIYIFMYMYISISIKNITPRKYFSSKLLLPLWAQVWHHNQAYSIPNVLDPRHACEFFCQPSLSTRTLHLGPKITFGNIFYNRKMAILYFIFVRTLNIYSWATVIFVQMPSKSFPSNLKGNAHFLFRLDPLFLSVYLQWSSCSLGPSP